jgi:hypothetical protein
MITKKFIISLILILVLNSLLFSQNNFSFIQKISNEKYSEKRELSLSILNNNKLLYNFIKTLEPYQSVPQVLILNNINLLLIFPQNGVIEFYDQNELLKNYSFYKIHTQNEQSIITSKNDAEVAILLSEEQINTIYFYNFGGTLIDSIKVEKGLISGLSISPDNNFIAYSVFNWEGNELKNKSVIIDKAKDKEILIDEKFSKGIFNKTDNLFLGFTNKNAFCIDLKNSNPIWKEKLNYDEIYLDGNFDYNNAIMIKADNPNLAGGEWIYPNAKVISKNNLGEETLLKEFISPYKKASLKSENEELDIKIDNQIFKLTK